MNCIDIFIRPVNNMETRRDDQQTLFVVRMRIDLIELYKNQAIVSCMICRTDPIEL